MIIKNAIRCNICGDKIESKHRHDFVTCKCGVRARQKQPIWAQLKSPI